MNKIGIVITCKNLLEYTRGAIESIETKYPFLLVVIDDFSTDETKEYLELLSQHYRDSAHIITDPLTYSLAEKWNIGAQYCFDADCDAVLICNNDIVFHPVTIDRLVERMEKGDVGMVTAHNMRGQSFHVPIPLPDQYKEVPGVTRAYVPVDITAETLAASPAPTPEISTEAPHPDFSCFLLSRSTWDTVGKFDEKFAPCYWEDSDFHLRMGKAKIKAIATTSAPYLHYGSRTQNSVEGGICKGEQFNRLRDYLRQKHGTVPGEPEYERICSGV